MHSFLNDQRLPLSNMQLPLQMPRDNLNCKKVMAQLQLVSVPQNYRVQRWKKKSREIRNKMNSLKELFLKSLYDIELRVTNR